MNETKAITKMKTRREGISEKLGGVVVGSLVYMPYEEWLKAVGHGWCIGLESRGKYIVRVLPQKTYEVTGLAGSNIIFKDQRGESVNGHGINQDRLKPAKEPFDNSHRYMAK